MKIIDAKLQVVEVPLPHPFPSTWNPGNPETKLFVTIAEIITDDGIHGYGAACDSSQLLAGIWDTHIRPLVIGKEITQVEAINTGLVNASLYAYRPWCVEVAVWDALGKYANLPIYKMLGGVQDKVLAYASTGSLKSVEERVEDAERYIAEGFKMMKLRAHHDDPFEDVRIIAEIKKRVGDKLKIAVDANQGWFFTGKRSVAKWDLKKALNVCRAFEEIGIEWIEEPLYGYDFEGLAELRKRTTLHVAGGELNAQVHEYRDLIKHNCFDIYQMDVVLSGGFVQNRKVAAMAEAENKIYTPHTWTHGMGMAAALREAVDGLSRESPRLAALRDRLIDGLTGLPYTRLTGDPVNRLPGTASFVFEGVEGEALLLHLDARGICASSGSACSSASLDPSHVLLAIGLPHAIAHGSLRLSLGAENTEADVDYILKEVPQVVAYLRELSPVWDRDAQKPTWEL